MINLSIIILSYNTKELLEKCLESVISNWLLVVSNHPPVTNHQLPTTEIIVVDNGSTDGSVEMLKKLLTTNHQPLITIRIIENKENLGFAKGNNQGVKEAGGKYVMFLNSDTIVNNKAISLLIDFLEKHPEVAAVSPLILNQDGSIQKDPCYLQFPSPIFTLFYYNAIFKKLVENFFPSLLYSTQNFSRPNCLAQLSGAALMIRKEIFDDIGGFDESYQHFFEDVDLSFRLKKKEYKLYLVPEAKIIHLAGKSLEAKVKKEGIESYYFLNFKSLFKFCEKNYSFFAQMLIKFTVFLHLLFGLRVNLIKRLFL